MHPNNEWCVYDLIVDGTRNISGRHNRTHGRLFERVGHKSGIAHFRIRRQPEPVQVIFVISGLLPEHGSCSWASNRPLDCFECPNVPYGCKWRPMRLWFKLVRLPAMQTMGFFLNQWRICGGGCTFGDELSTPHVGFVLCIDDWT